MPADFKGLFKWGILLVILVVLFIVSNIFRSIFADFLWFESLGFGGVFIRILLTKTILFLIGAVTAGILMGAALYLANKFSAGEIGIALDAGMKTLFTRGLAAGSWVVSLVVGVIFGAIFSSKWELFLRFTNSTSFDRTDPVFGQDISFFVFTLPGYSFLQGWLLALGIVLVVGSLAISFANYTLRGIPFSFSPALRIQLSVVVAFILFSAAWGHWIDRWELVLSDHGAVFGAAYTDLYARKPALLILTIIALSGGLFALINAYLKGLRLLVGAVGLWLICSVILSVGFPSLIQNFSVNPNEFVREEPYIQRNIDYTRDGFDLEKISETFYQADPSVSSEQIQDNMQTVNNIRLWDHRPLTDVYRQIQLIRPYYDFMGADVDRYRIGGEYTQVLLAPREVAPEKLAEESQTWVNKRLFYTHGIGLAMSPVTAFTPEGRPEFFAKDIPSDGSIPISAPESRDSPDFTISNPRIYYGENTAEYVVVNTNTNELDYQTGSGDLFYRKYTGSGGVPVGSFFRRLVYAWEMRDINLLISREITTDSLIQYRRQISDRISTVAPYLVLDEDPYVVAADGKLFWLQDAYTVSDHFPYSDPIKEIAGDHSNYMRNSVKVVVDAYNGDLTFYIWDDVDPIVETYSRIFPQLFKPRSEMPASLQEHVRYPQDFFVTQAKKYIKYHMKNPQNFYNNEDLWSLPNEKFGQGESLQVVEPYYVIMRLPGEKEAEFTLLLPYTPNNRPNMVGWLAARSDGDNYGKLEAFNFPKDRQVDGPEQVEARIDNDQDISAWFTLRCSEGSSCIRGNLLVIPIGNSILYAEPVYIQAEGVSFPELKKVILATGDKVVMADSLGEALDLLTESTKFARIGDDIDPPSQELEPSDRSYGVTEGGPIRKQIELVEKSLNELNEGLISIEEALHRLKELIGGE